VFVRTSLRTLGLRIQLGHTANEPCPSRRPAHKNFTVIHVNGVHEVDVDFCECSKSIHLLPRQQLLRRQLFPATVHQPRLCATFQVLQHYHLQSVHTKVSAYHFYEALERETDNTGIDPLKVRNEFELYRFTCFPN